MTYRTFIRSARNFEQFASARKRPDRRGLTYAEAVQRCAAFDRERTSRQVSNGTKMEFERECNNVSTVPHSII